MEFSQYHAAVSKTDHRAPLEFAPTSMAILPVEAFPITDTHSTCNGFNLRDLAKDLKLHLVPLCHAENRHSILS